MSETFACPHCGTEFPVLTCLVQRKVRCSACRSPFRLRRDGQVEALTAPPATATAAAANNPHHPPTDKPPRPQRSRTATDEELLRMTWSWVEGEQTRSQQRDSRNRTIGMVEGPERVTRRHDAIRSKLRQAAEQAVAGQVSAQTTPALTAPHQVFLSGSGSRPRPYGRILLVLLLLGGLAAWLLNRPGDPIEIALRDYAAAGGADSITDHLDRAWIGSLDGRTAPVVLSDIGSIKITARDHIDLAQVQDLFIKDMRGMQALHPLACFVDVKDLPRLRQLAVDMQGSGLAAIHSAALEQGLRLVPYNTLVTLLHERGYSGRVLHCLALLLVGDPADARRDSVGEQWMNREPPVMMEIAEVDGHDASMLVDVGNGMRQRQLPRYRAILVRFRGGAEPERWRLLDCHRPDDINHLDNVLQQRYLIARRTHG